MAALNKLLAEARLEEVKTILGWIFDLRLLTIALPDNKFTVWSKALCAMLKKASLV